MNPIHSILRALALVAVLTLFSVSTGAQTPSSDELDDLKQMFGEIRSDVNTFKIHTLSQVMQLSEAEAETFWPIYQEYEEALAGVGMRRLSLIREYLALEAEGERESKPWNDLARRALKLRRERLNLWEKYQKKIKREVSAYRAAQFLQVEQQMALVVDLSVASELPVIGSGARGAATSTDLTVPTRKQAVLVTLEAEVEAVDYANREVTLRGPLGNLVTLTVDESVKRLDEVKAGDHVEADYYVSLAAELRSPTAEEQQNPLVIMEGAAKAPGDRAPAGGTLNVIKAVCTIEGLDRPSETVTLQGPQGRYVSVLVADPANLPQLRIGDTVVVTYTEALAISLKKVKD